MAVNLFQNPAGILVQTVDYDFIFEHVSRAFPRKRLADFIRLGIFGHWDNPYLTLKSQYEATIVKVFGELVEKGYIYRGLKPIH
ncbi:MAG: class I tRNA ligase family protein, partial [Treponema sp.]|nr:class I tRNA ligase family protein [Treponema sp.]